MSMKFQIKNSRGKILKRLRILNLVSILLIHECCVSELRTADFNDHPISSRSLLYYDNTADRLIKFSLNFFSIHSTRLWNGMKSRESLMRRLTVFAVWWVRKRSWIKKTQSIFIISKNLKAQHSNSKVEVAIIFVFVPFRLLFFSFPLIRTHNFLDRKLKIHSAFDFLSSSSMLVWSLLKSPKKEGFLWNLDGMGLRQHARDTGKKIPIRTKKAIDVVDVVHVLEHTSDEERSGEQLYADVEWIVHGEQRPADLQNICRTLLGRKDERIVPRLANTELLCMKFVWRMAYHI